MKKPSFRITAEARDDLEALRKEEKIIMCEWINSIVCEFLNEKGFIVKEYFIKLSHDFITDEYKDSEYDKEYYR